MCPCGLRLQCVACSCITVTERCFRSFQLHHKLLAHSCRVTALESTAILSIAGLAVHRPRLPLLLFSLAPPRAIPGGPTSHVHAAIAATPRMQSTPASHMDDAAFHETSLAEARVLQGPGLRLNPGSQQPQPKLAVSEHCNDTACGR